MKYRIISLYLLSVWFIICTLYLIFGVAPNLISADNDASVVGGIALLTLVPVFTGLFLRHAIKEIKQLTKTQELPNEETINSPAANGKPSSL